MQVGQVLLVVKLPKNVFRVSRIVPLPLQELHEIFFVPFLAPVPSHAWHWLIFEMSTLRSLPKIASRNGNSMSIEMSLPRRAPPPKGDPAPPKNSPKISPKTNS